MHGDAPATLARPGPLAALGADEVSIARLRHLIAAPPAALPRGAPTGSVCPPTSAPTYASFGQQFMANYCTSCHSANSTNRHGAPGGQNYDTEADVKRHAADIDAAAAKGPPPPPTRSCPSSAAPSPASRPTPSARCSASTSPA